MNEEVGWIQKMVLDVSHEKEDAMKHHTPSLRQIKDKKVGINDGGGEQYPSAIFLFVHINVESTQSVSDRPTELSS